MKYLLLLLSVLWAAPARAEKRALVIGIDDYTASTLRRTEQHVEHRGWPDLKGAANDARLLRDMLVSRYGFAPRNVLTLTNQEATRAAIMEAIERHLVVPARSGDIVFYYFAGHGSQVPNAASDEPDRLDESIVPADSRLGAADIRDKELRTSFNRILDRGAYLTLLLDHCHSGSAFRGGAQTRGVRRAPPIVDSRAYGPRPEERGALVVASTQDLDDAWETTADDGTMHGAFTWAWVRALRDAAGDEPAHDTFLRAQARLRAEKPYQAPVMLGPAEARLRPFLSRDAQPDRRRIAVERVAGDGRVILQGGFADGLSVGDVVNDGATRMRITQILGPGRSVARTECGPAMTPGALVAMTTSSARWDSLESRAPTPYHLELRREKTKELVRNGIVIGHEIYSIVLRRSDSPEIAPRHYYVVVIDSRGKRQLVFPPSGSVENRFARNAAEIDLGDPSAFRVAPPYGIDTYVLLSMDEPLANPSILTWDGVRSARVFAANRWSIERRTFESIPPRH